MFYYWDIPFALKNETGPNLGFQTVDRVTVAAQASGHFIFKMENPKSPVAEVANQPQEPPKWEGQSQAAAGRVNPAANEKKKSALGSQNLAQGAAAAPGCMLWCRVQPHQLPELAKLWERPVVKALSEISLLLNTGNSFKHIKKKNPSQTKQLCRLGFKLEKSD